MTLYLGKYRIESTRLAGWNYASRGWYFVTICTAGRVNSLGTIHGGAVSLSPTGVIAQNELLNIASHYQNIRLDSSVIMPNHVHAIIVIEGEHAYTPGLGFSAEQPPAAKAAPGSLGAIVRSYKAGVARTTRERGFPFGWQKGYYDHILRGEKAVSAVRDYIESNPAHWDE